MLIHDETALCGRMDLRVIGKDPTSRHNQVSLEPRNRLKSLVPCLERDFGLLAFRRWSPPC
jgi:hypothetical protein